jgi:HEAT repeat protein
MEFLDHDDELLRAKAVGALGAIGPSALPAASVVAERLVFDEVDDVRRRAAGALGRFGPEVNEILIVLSKDEEPEVRRLALFAMSEQTKLESKLQPVISEGLQDPHDTVRLEAAKTAVHHQMMRSESLRTSVHLLFSRNRSVSVDAAKLLEQLDASQAELESDLDREKLKSNARARALIQKLLRSAAEQQP